MKLLAHEILETRFFLLLYLACERVFGMIIVYVCVATTVVVIVTRVYGTSD